MTVLAPSMAPTYQPPFGQQLKHHRKMSKLSQMDLALACSTTPRHVSFVETGRSRPGRDLVLRMAKAMALAPRQTNRLLVAAGLPPAFAETPLDEGEMTAYRDAVEMILNRHNPYPACALDRLGQVVLYNDAFKAFSPQLIGKTAEEIMADFFEDGPLRQMIENWDEAAWTWSDRLSADYAATGLPELGALFETVQRHMANVPRPSMIANAATKPDAMLTLKLRLGGQVIETFTTVLRFETARDVTLSELRVELIFPKNPAAVTLFERLAAGAVP